MPVAITWRAWRGGIHASRLVFLVSGTLGRLLGLFIVLGSLGGCTAPTLLTAVLGPPLKPLPVAGKLRRPVYKPYHEETMTYNLVPPPKTDWPSKLKALPLTAAGGTDWIKALNENLIKPKPGLDAKAEDQPVMDLDVVLTPKDMPDFKVTYPHKPHTQILSCDNCHTGIFQMQAGADPITMEKIFAGEYCGRCHGPVAFDPASACPRCHTAMPQ